MGIYKNSLQFYRSIANSKDAGAGLEKTKKGDMNTEEEQ